MPLSAADTKTPPPGRENPERKGSFLLFTESEMLSVALWAA